jgi:hypothetical protein
MIVERYGEKTDRRYRVDFDRVLLCKSAEALKQSLQAVYVSESFNDSVPLHITVSPRKIEERSFGLKTLHHCIAMHQ